MLLCGGGARKTEQKRSNGPAKSENGARFRAALFLCLSALWSLPAWAADEAAGARAPAKTKRCVPNEAPERLTAKQLACIGGRYGPHIKELQEADPVADARRKAAQGDFRLLSVYATSPDSWEPGIVCVFKPPKTLIRDEFLSLEPPFIPDIEDLLIPDAEGLRLYGRFQSRYVRAYNRTLVAHRGFPYPDLCRLRSAEEKNGPVFRNLSDLRRRPSDRRRAQNLHEAVRFHDRAAVRRFLQQGADPNELDAWGFTPLGWAVLTGRADLVRDLLAAGADPNRHGKERPTPLVLAVYARSLSLVRQLVANGANVNLESPAFQEVMFSDAPQHGGPPLRAAVRVRGLKIARFLLKKGADPNFKSASWLPPIFPAIKDRRPQMIQLLLERGADVHHRDGYGLSVIQFAAEQRYAEGVRMVAEAGGVADARSAAERALWQTALKEKRQEILADLVAFGAHAHLLKTAERQKLLAHIARNERRDVLDLLAVADRRAAELEKAIGKGDLDQVRNIYTGGAELAEGRMRTGLIMAVEARQVPVIAWFLDRGADPLEPVYYGNLDWMRDKSKKKHWLQRGRTALALAFEYGPMEAIRLIMAHADLSGQRNLPFSESVLGMAFTGYKKHQDPEIIDLAVKLTGDIPKTGLKADEFLVEICQHTGRQGPQVLERYLKRGYRPGREADPPSRKVDYPSGDWVFQECLYRGAENALLLLHYGGNPQGDFIGDALDRLYTDEAALEVIKELLKRGADPNRPDASGNVALDKATPSREEMDRGAVQGVSEWEWSKLEKADNINIEELEKEVDRLQERIKAQATERFRRARRLLRKYGAKTRAELEKEGVLKPRPKPKSPMPELPVR